MEKDLLHRLVLPPVFWIFSLLALPKILLFLYPAFPNKQHFKPLFYGQLDLLSPFILSYHIHTQKGLSLGHTHKNLLCPPQLLDHLLPFKYL